jgi:hypothetical protein
MRLAFAADCRRAGHLPIAAALIGDSDHDCRWQAAIVVGHFIPDRPDSVWRVIVRYGKSAEPDLAAALATALLEHLLDRHGSRYLRRLKPLVAAPGSPYRDLVRMTWRSGACNQARRLIPRD